MDGLRNQRVRRRDKTVGKKAQKGLDRPRVEVYYLSLLAGNTEDRGQRRRLLPEGLRG
jgi:hypothetical protein